jgi:asparagine synthase (glutamine-hydrolysing)
MTDTLHHRGPDDSDTWVDGASGVALGHRRLSILDLSPLGRQPMASACGRFVIVYNGEVYNHREIRRELADYPFRSSSDTETILAAVARWGIADSVARFVGMFAFALWDREERTLTLVRDRLGIKPLYYGVLDGALLFGSELKAIRACPDARLSIDRNALTLFFRHNYIPAPHSIYQGVRKLEPGTMAVFGPGAAAPELVRYWSVRDVWAEGNAHPFAGTDRECVDALESLVGEAVTGRMLSDVPIGAFLSGGIDSSTVVALMQANSARPVKTFSIGFHETSFNEAQHARAVADHLGTDHTELYVTPREMLDVIPSIPTYWDEPFADSSQIPTFLLSKLTRRHVTVSLSGDGGDELFAGYDRYFWTDRVCRSLSMIPRPLRSVAARIGKALPNGLWNMLGGLGPKVRWRLDALASRDLESLYRYFVSHFKAPASFVLGGSEPPGILEGEIMDDKWAWMSLYDLSGYLPEDILTKVDRASMAVGLEARVPLIDHRVVEFAARIPTAMKMRDGQGKWPLRQVLYRHVPRELVDRPKMGFGVPIERWMREDLRGWCEDLLSPDAIRRGGYVDAELVARMWREYLAGETNWHYYLWDVLMFQAWLETVE